MTVPEQNDWKEREPGRDGLGGSITAGLINRDRPSESAIDSLFYEQGKLRAEMDRLLSAAAASSAVAKSSEPAAPAKDKEAGKADSDAGKPDAGKDDDKDAPKEPFRKRAANWTRAHPIATVAILILLVVVAVGGWFLWGYLQSYESVSYTHLDVYKRQLEPYT